MTKIVKVQGLQKKFGKFQALSDVTFTVEAGEVVGFIGPNGAGKSTTIRILLGIIKRDAGNAGIFGKDVWKDRSEERRVGKEWRYREARDQSKKQRRYNNSTQDGPPT